MSDIKLFKIAGATVVEIAGASMPVEKDLQVLFESSLDAFLGVHLLASEYRTGETHAGRIDTLGIDENHCPVIIEYKRALNENVINQGLFYLDWLLDHKAEFILLVQRTIGQVESDQIEWSAPRLLCIAGDFTKYDVHAVKQINRNIELIRYRRYGSELLLLDLVNATSSRPGATAAAPLTAPSSDLTPAMEPSPTASPTSPGLKTVTGRLVQSTQALKDLFDEARDYMLGLGDDVQLNTLKFYFAFKRLKNFACVEVQLQPPALVFFLKVDPTPDILEPGFTRDVRSIGHYGTGSLEVVIASAADLERARGLIARSYEAS